MKSENARRNKRYLIAFTAVICIVAYAALASTHKELAFVLLNWVVSIFGVVTLFAVALPVFLSSTVEKAKELLTTKETSGWVMPFARSWYFMTPSITAIGVLDYLADLEPTFFAVAILSHCTNFILGLLVMIRFWANKPEKRG